MKRVLMVDVGGTHVKMLAAGHEGYRKFPSHSKLRAETMVKAVLETTADWKFNVVSLGFPGVVIDGKPARNPMNLGSGWVEFNYEKAFQRPVKIINDASMQALAHYTSGRMLFIGLGTSVGVSLIVDDVVIPMEAGELRLTKTKRFIDAVSRTARQKRGKRRWDESVHVMIALLKKAFWPDEIVLGGGNAKELQHVPDGCRVGDNQDGFRGALRLWPGADLLAEPQHTTWIIRRPKQKRKSRRSA